MPFPLSSEGITLDIPISNNNRQYKFKNVRKSEVTIATKSPIRMQVSDIPTRFYILTLNINALIVWKVETDPY